MPDDSSRTSGQQYMPSHASQHTSAHDVAPHSEHITTHLPTPPRSADSGGLPAFPGIVVPAALRVVVADDNPVVRAGLTVLLSGRDDIEVVGEAADGRQAYDVAQGARPDVILLDVRMPGVDGISALPHLVRLCPVLMLTYSREVEIVQEALRLGAGGYLVHGEFTADQLVDAVRDIKQGRAHFTATAANALLDHMRQGPSPSGGQPLPEGLGSVYATGVPYAGEGHPPALPQAQSANAHGNVYPPTPPHGVNMGYTNPSYGHNPSSSYQGVSQLQPNMGQSSTESPVAAARHNRESFGLSSREVEIMDLIASGMTNHQIAATCFISEKTVKNHINRIFGKVQSTSRSEAIAKWLGTTPGSGTGRSAVGHG